MSGAGCQPASDGADQPAEETTATTSSMTDGGPGMTSQGSIAGSGSVGDDDSSDDDGPLTTGPIDDTGPEPIECETASLFQPGVHTEIAVDVDGESRTYNLFVPASYDPAVNAPLVVNFHGLLGTPSQQSDFSQFNAAAEEHGMLVAYPAGIGNSFNAGVCCGSASSENVDDVGFARALVNDVALKMCVDRNRVHATGMSNGGHMAHRLACEAADVFASTASVTGVLSLAGPCVPSRPVSIVQFHGTADTIVGYNAIPAVLPMMEAWAARNGCASTSTITFDQGDTQCQTWPGCDADVEVSLCTIDGGGHCWPGNSSCIFGHSTTELHASEVIAAMFHAQPLP